MKRSSLARRTPMKRTAFSIPESRMPERPVARDSSPPTLSPRPEWVARSSMGPAQLQASPKRVYVRSEALMRAYRQLPCQHCGREDGTVCGAHPNWSDGGKGGHIKADDNLCASLCFSCHRALDQGSRLTYDERRALHEAARRKTLAELISRGLWPSEVPVPAA